MRKTVKSSCSPAPVSVESVALPLIGTSLSVLIGVSGEILLNVVFEKVRENERRTSGESSASTLRARSAEDARQCVGRGIEMVLYGYD